MHTVTSPSLEPHWFNNIGPLLITSDACGGVLILLFRVSFYAIHSLAYSSKTVIIEDAQKYID